MNDFKMAAVADDWRTSNSRQNMVSKIEEAIQNCGSATSKNAVEMESQVFSKAKSKDEYLSFVARLLIHIKEMTAKNQASGNHQAAGQQGNNMMGMPQQNNLGMGNQMNNMGGMNNMGVNVNNNMGQQNFGMNNAGQMQILPGHPQSTSPMIGQQMQQQQQLQQQQQIQQQQQQHIQQQQLQQQQMQQQHQLQQQQQMNQNPQQMMGPGFMQPQQQQQQQIQQQQMQQQQMQQQQMQNSQLQQGQIQSTQIQQNPQLQGMLASQQQQQQQQLMAARGLTNPQMVQNRMMAPQPNMASQLSQMAQQQQRKEGGVGMLGGQYGSNQMQIQRPMGQSQFMPNVAQGVPSGPVASPDRPQGNQSQGYANSPGSASMMHSPAGPGINVNNALRPFQGHYGTAPSPGSSLNTPHSIVGATPSPRTADDLACFEKIKELRKYTPLLERMIAKIGNDDVEKSSKMKKLLEILVNPNQRVSMEILLKCEIALKKMEKQNDVGVGIPVSAQVAPGKEQSTPFQHLLESVIIAMTHSSAAHTCRRTFQPALDALLGYSFATSNDDESDDDSLECEDGSSEIPWVLQKQLQQLDNSRFRVTSTYPGLDSPFGFILDCVLADPRLPSVPHLKVKISPTYPDDSPTIVDLDSTFATTPFFSAVGAALKSRMYYFSDKYTLPELLNAWEMSVRQVSGPNFKIPEFFMNEQTVRLGL